MQDRVKGKKEKKVDICTRTVQGERKRLSKSKISIEDILHLIA